MKKSPSAPAAPDPAATAAAQGAANKETAIAQARLNQIEEITPFGKSFYEKTGQTQDGIEMMRRTTQLTPEQQAIVNQQTDISRQLNELAGQQTGRVGTALATPFSYAGLPAAPAASENARQQTIDALYGQYRSRLDPQFQEQQTALETSLANQGIPVGSDAYNRAVESFGRTRNDAYTSALNQSIGAGGAEQSRLFGLGGAERERAIQEASYLRNLPLQEAAALMGTAPGVTMPQFSPIPQTAIAPTDITGPTALAYQGQMNQYNQQQGARNAAMGGLFGLGGSALGGWGMSGFKPFW